MYFSARAKKAVPVDEEGSVTGGLKNPRPIMPKPKPVRMALNAGVCMNINGKWIFPIIKPNGDNYSCGPKTSQNWQMLSGTLGIVFGKDMPIVGSFKNGVLIFTCVAGQTSRVFTMLTTDYPNFKGTYKYE